MRAEVVGDGRRQHQPTSKALFIVLRDPPSSRRASALVRSTNFCVAQRSASTTRAEVKGSAPSGFSMPPDVARRGFWAGLAIAGDVFPTPVRGDLTRWRVARAEITRNYAG